MGRWKRTSAGMSSLTKDWSISARPVTMREMDETNPYAAPKAELLPTDADASRTRFEHLRTEGHVKALGWLLAAISITSLFGDWLGKKFRWADFSVEPGLWAIGWDVWLISIVAALAGVGLIRLNARAWWLAVLWSAALALASLINLPSSLVGMVFHAVILRFLFLKPTRRVLDPSYANVLRLTPLIQSTTATWIRPVLLLFVLWAGFMLWLTSR